MSKKEISIPGTYGTISATHYAPKNKNNTLVLFGPGFCNSKDYRDMTEHAKLFAGFGCEVVVFNPTGTWSSDGGIEQYTTTQYIEDMKDVHEHMFNEDTFSRIVVGGYSMGGSVAVHYAARQSVDGVIAIMPPSIKMMTDELVREWEHDGYKTMIREDPESGEEIDIKVPFSHVTDKKKYDVLEDIANIQAPVFLFSGKDDDVVFPADVYEIYDQCPKGNRTYFMISDVTHKYRISAEETAQVNRALANVLKSFL